MNTKERIIQAAIEVFATDFSATTQKIADQAGVSRRTLVRHFENKRDLVRTVAHRVMTNYYEQVKPEIKKTQDPVERLQVMFCSCIDCGSQLGFLRNLLDQSELTKDSELFTDFTDLMLIFQETLHTLKEEEIISPHITLGWAEYAFHGMAEGAAMALRDGAVAPREINVMAWKSFWNSIKKH